MEDTPTDLMIRLITRHQGALRGYIQSLMPDKDRQVDDVLQETNLVLWHKAEQYDPSRPFMPWACGIAFFQVKAARRDTARDRHVFDSDLLELLATEDFADAEKTDALDHALQDCLAQLPAKKRELILDRYHPESTVASIATARKQTPNAISLELHRIRHQLEACIERKLSQSLS